MPLQLWFLVLSRSLHAHGLYALVNACYTYVHPFHGDTVIKTRSLLTGFRECPMSYAFEPEARRFGLSLNECQIRAVPCTSCECDPLQFSRRPPTAGNGVTAKILRV